MIQPTCPPTNFVAGSFLLPSAKDCSRFRVYKRDDVSDHHYFPVHSYISVVDGSYKDVQRFDDLTDSKVKYFKFKLKPYRW